MKSQSKQRPKPRREPVQPLDPRVVQFLFSRWQPERPELLFRLRPRLQEESHVIP